MTFSDFGLPPELLRAVTEKGYDVPTPIQAQAIPHALKGSDILGIVSRSQERCCIMILRRVHR